MGLYSERERERMSFGQGREEMVKTETFCNLGSGSDEGTEKTCNKNKENNKSFNSNPSLSFISQLGVNGFCGWLSFFFQFLNLKSLMWREVHDL